MNLITILVYTLILFKSSTVLAYSGLELLQQCEGKNGNTFEVQLSQAHCLGYIQGIFAMVGPLNLVTDLLNQPQTICFPEKITAGQLQLVVIKWLLTNPEKLHESAALAVLTAFRKAFPCK